MSKDEVFGYIAIILGLLSITFNRWNANRITALMHRYHLKSDEKINRLIYIIGGIILIAVGLLDKAVMFKN